TTIMTQPLHLTGYGTKPALAYARASDTLMLLQSQFSIDAPPNSEHRTTGPRRIRRRTRSAKANRSVRFDGRATGYVASARASAHVDAWSSLGAKRNHLVR